MENELRQIFQKQISILNKAKRATGEAPKKDDAPGFALSNFWLHYTLGVNSLSNSLTRLAVILTDSAPSEEVSIVKDCIMEIEASYMSMVNAYTSLPKSQGAQLCKVLGNATEAILSPLHQYFTKVHKNPRDETQAEVVGVVWRCCELVSGLPKDNRAAVVKLIESERDLIKDALDELQEELRTKRTAGSMVVTVEDVDDDGSTSWSQSDVDLVTGGASLVNTVHILLNRMIALLSSTLCSRIEPKSLDLLSSTVSLLSPSLDDFISSLYPPLDLSPLPDQVDQVITTVKTLMDLLSKLGMVKNQDEGWTKEIKRRLDTDDSDLRRLITSSQITSLSIH